MVAPFTTAYVAAVIAVSLKTVIDDLSLLVIVLAAIAVLIPGYTINLGVAELVSGIVVPGAADLFNGLMILAEWFLGAWIAYNLVAAIVDRPAEPSAGPVSDAWQWLFTPLLVAEFAIVFQTAPRNFLWACSACLLAYPVLLGGRELTNENIGTFLRACAAVVFANI